MGEKTALILGSSGLVGNELVKILLEQNNYKKIHLLLRRPIEITDSRCEPHIVDFEQLGKYDKLFKVTDVFCCLGTTIKKAKSKEAFRKVDYQYPIEGAKLAVQSGAEKFLIITAMGANSKSFFFYNQVKGEVEMSLKTLNIPSLNIFRPSLLLGERNEFRLGEKIAEKASGLLNTLMMGPLRSYKAIHAKSVAKAMAAIAASNKTGVSIFYSNEIQRIADKH
ncbi:oxidoreductase [Paenibacillus sp. BSR1-1]|uniref:oxidoreductase n=1 Tax=Paenibacillus sp. BSR1-1 TaxID=3020845 RepID=UPI0025B10688|nr:oxidoreductase [Paenibacillus sp. BSR1-1]MDN3016331.1 oxidoreductase [Paenibacillus sp. BSR1-1]